MKLIIFDFDGLILDTETPDYESWQEIYGELGATLSLDAWADCIGARAGVFDPVAHLENLIGRALVRDEIEHRRRVRFHEMVAAQPLCPGIEEYLADAQGFGVQLAVASSATRDWVEGHLDRFGVRDAFSCIRCVEDVQHAKPAPDLFQAVLEALNVPAPETIVLEDSPNGILAANRAGTYSVAVPNPVTRNLDMAGARLIVDSLIDWPLHRLLPHARDGRD